MATKAIPDPIYAALTEFLDAFTNLDLDRFLACWDADATVIHPFPGLPKRVAGDQVRTVWAAVFDGIRASMPGPPYLDLRPIDTDVRTAGRGVAIATFHLELDGGLGRRTLVLEESGTAWKVVHLHASNVYPSARRANA